MLCHFLALSDSKLEEFVYTPFPDTDTVAMLVNPVFCIWPQILNHIKSYVILGNTTRKEYYSMPGPSLAIFYRYVQSTSIHCVQEGHLIMWMVVMNLPPPQGK